MSETRDRARLELADWELFCITRRRRELRQHVVARKAGILPSILCGYERGRKVLSEETVERLWAAMDELVEDRMREAATLSEIRAA